MTARNDGAANAATRRATRRRLVFTALASGTLAACGFHPRGQIRLPFSNLHVQAPANTPLGQELRRALRASQVPLIETPAGAAATLAILSELQEREILSLGGTGRVREYQLRYRLAYQVTDGKGRVLSPPAEIVLKRDISYSEEDAIAKESEIVMLYRDMRSDAVQQLLRRLQALTLAQL